MSSRTDDHSTLLASLVGVVLQHETLGGLIPVQALGALHYLSGLLDREVGEPMAQAADREDLDAIVSERTSTVINGLAGIGLVMASELGPQIAELLKRFAADLKGGELGAKLAGTLPGEAQGKVLESLHTLSRHLGRILRSQNPELILPFVRFSAGLLSLGQRSLRDPDLLAEYCREQMNVISEIVSREPLPSESARQAVPQASDEAFARAVMAEWVRRGRAGGEPTAAP